MNRLNSALVFLILTGVCISITSCKEEEKDPVLGHITINGESVEINDCSFFIDEEGELVEGDIHYYHDINFGNFTGKGGIWVSSICVESPAIEDGTYILVSRNSKYLQEVGEFNQLGDYGQFTTATMTIEKSGEEYIIHVEGVGDESSIDLDFEGTVVYY